MKRYSVERVRLNKCCYDSYVRTYGADLVQNVLDAFEFPEVNLKNFDEDILIECNLSQ